MSLIISPYAFGSGAPNGKVWFGENGVWHASGDPATGANPAFTGIVGTYFPCVALYRGSVTKHKVTGRFVGADQTYSPPSGFSAVTGAFNPSDKSANIALTNTDRTAEKSTADATALVRATVSKSAGKWYFEVIMDAAGTSPFICVGIATSAEPTNSAPGVRADSYSLYQQTGQKYNNNVLSAYGNSYTTGDIIMVAFEL